MFVIPILTASGLILTDGTADRIWIVNILGNNT